MTRLVLGCRNESLIPYFPGAYSPQDEEKVKSKDINIIQWGKYFRTSKYWVQWGSRVLGCLGSLFIRAMRTPWKEIYSVCVCVCVCALMHTLAGMHTLCMPLLNSLVYKIQGQLLPNNFNTIACNHMLKARNEETDFRPGRNSITEQQKQERTNKGWSCTFANELMQLIKKFRLFQMPVPTEVKVQKTAWRG